MLTRLTREANRGLGRLKPFLSLQPPHLEQQIFARLIRRGDTVFDVGAKYGSLALEFSRLTGRRGRIYAFEPLIPNYHRLCQKLQSAANRHGNIFPFPLGLADAPGQTRLSVIADARAMASIARHESWSSIGKGAIEEYQCQLARLDDLLHDFQLPAPDLLKIDVVGAELMVLHGALRLLGSAQAPALFLDLFAPWQRGFGYGPWDVLHLLEGLGYRVWFVCPEGLVSHTVSQACPTPPEFVNGYSIVALAPAQHGDRIGRLEPLLAGRGGRIGRLPRAAFPNQ